MAAELPRRGHRSCGRAESSTAGDAVEGANRLRLPLTASASADNSVTRLQLLAPLPSRKAFGDVRYRHDVILRQVGQRTHHQLRVQRGRCGHRRHSRTRTARRTALMAGRRARAGETPVGHGDLLEGCRCTGMFQEPAERKDTCAATFSRVQVGGYDGIDLSHSLDGDASTEVLIQQSPKGTRRTRPALGVAPEFAKCLALRWFRVPCLDQSLYDHEGQLLCNAQPRGSRPAVA
mmetsp:Transcript_11689/g.31476  ORF Transcript_11689/g.31476 Transcript_11689/m.31476 type:complete len:234 (-) Transcript_11689:394-1095(-)